MTMTDDKVSFGMTIPLDSDGFLRRECPTCEREFKWRPSEAEVEEHDEPADTVGYFCPYCGVRAPDGGLVGPVCC
jgi:DNA-directed RNA polymerase subunit RPC12/RpoP